VELSAYFYDRLELQLDEIYGIRYSSPTAEIIDHKKEILNILEIIKKDNPTRGLVVVIDEVSDFLKTKTKEKINRDVQFLRVLAQAAQNSDFSLILAMQEHVFNNPKYVDEAESFGRTLERYHVITIKREDIKRVISRRVLSKTQEQRLELENLFEEYTKYFPTLRAKMGEYIDLFPLHPYVIQVFSELPYFEKRGVIQFTIQEVEKVLDREFPYMITYDRIFDEINSKHAVKNLETVSPIIEAVQTLESKIDLLEERHQGLAQNMVKALSVLKLYGKSTSNGATIEELANTLLILPANKLVEARDELSLVLSKLRKVTDGQFINQSKDGYYFLDLSLDIDYDQVILRRTENLTENALDDEILSILKDQLLLQEGEQPDFFNDTCRWPSRRSFREGSFIYTAGKDQQMKLSGDYQIVFLSPFSPKNPYTAKENSLILSGELNPEVTEELKKVAAAHALMADNYHRSTMEKKYITLKRNFTEKLVQAYLEKGHIDTGVGKKSLKSLISREFTNFDELFSEIKPALLDEYFVSEYPDHPKFTREITRDNIQGEFSNALKELLTKNVTQPLFSSSKSVLNAFDLLDEQGNINTTCGKAVARIREIAKDNEGKNVDIKAVIKEFSANPYGFDKLMTAFITVILTYNGEISLKAAGGKTISSSEIEEVFSSGIEAFENIRYITLESDLDIQPVIDLFMALELKPDKLRVTVRRGEAVQEFRTRYLEIKEQTEFTSLKLAKLSLYETDLLDINGLVDKQDILSTIPLEDFDGVKTPTGLKKIVYPQSRIKEIRNAYQFLKKLTNFYEVYFSDIEKEVEYVREIQKLLVEHPAILVMEGADGMITDAFDILGDSDRLIAHEELNSLLGKLQQVRKKYTIVYYKAHEKYVGGKVDWVKLETLTVSQSYGNLKMLKNISLLNTSAFIKIENEISRLAQLQCTRFKVDMLEDKVLCPYCQFPSGFSGQNINSKAEELEQRIINIFSDWEKSILVELQNYKDNIQYLQKNERIVVEAILKKGRLPEVVTEEIVIALNNLFKELECLEITPDEFLRGLFQDSQVMDYFTFVRKLDDAKQKLVAGKDLDKVRIKLAEEASSNE